MKKFRFPLENYLKVKKIHEQAKLGDLAKVMQRVNVFREQQQAFDEQYNNMLTEQRRQFVGREVPIQQMRDMYEYLGALRLRKDTATRNIAELEGEVNEKRNAYNSARKDRRVIEVLLEKKWAEYRLDLEKEEIGFMDEFNQARGRKSGYIDKAKKEESP